MIRGQVQPLLCMKQLQNWRTKIFCYVLLWLQGSLAQRRQSTRLFLQSSEIRPPHPLTLRRVCPPPPLVPGVGAHSLTGEVVGGSQFGRGDRHCGTLGIYALCGREASNPNHFMSVTLSHTPVDHLLWVEAKAAYLEWTSLRVQWELAQIHLAPMYTQCRYSIQYCQN